MPDMQDIQVPIFAILFISLKFPSDPHFPDLHKCVPEKECPATATDMEIPEGLPGIK